MKTFPMFLRRAGRDVVIMGGSEQVAQKARPMVRTEARLTLAALTLDAELAALVASRRATRRTDPAGPAFLSRAALVFAVSRRPALDARTVALARAGGALVNAVDQPDLFEAFTPSIVDRDPVVVAIVTESTAPQLGRQIETRIEGLMEPTPRPFAARSRPACRRPDSGRSGGGRSTRRAGPSPPARNAPPPARSRPPSPPAARRMPTRRAPSRWWARAPEPPTR